MLNRPPTDFDLKAVTTIRHFTYSETTYKVCGEIKKAINMAHGMRSPISPSPYQSLPTRVEEKIGNLFFMCTTSMSHRTWSGNALSF